MEIDNELKEILKPNKTVLLIWDVQNRLVHNIFNTQSFLDNNKSVISSAKQHGVQVVFSKITPLPENFESPVRKYFFKKRFTTQQQSSEWARFNY